MVLFDIRLSFLYNNKHMNITQEINLEKQAKQGRPRKLEKELKKSRSIRITDIRNEILIKRYGRLQKAIDYFIKEDDKIWE